MNAAQTLIIFAKHPVAGRAKTRLSPAITPIQAARLSECFLQDVLALARLASTPAVVYYTPVSARPYFTRAAPGFRLAPQCGRSLGERMHHALAGELARGCASAILIGSDLPQLDPQVIYQALAALRGGAEVVLGPALDGGYYLIGLRAPHPELFRVKMSTPHVLHQTLERIESAGLSLAFLPAYRDVDTIEDLKELDEFLAAHPAVPATHTRAWLAQYPSLTPPLSAAGSGPV